MGITGLGSEGGKLGDIVLMAGGWSSTDARRTVIFNTKTGAAREVASLKHPRYNPGMVVHKGQAIILGGYGRYVRRSDGEVWNMDTETWEDAEISLNNARSRFSLVVMAEKIGCEPKYQPKGELF